MFDKLGNEVFVGDILVASTGGAHTEDGDFTTYTVWEMPHDYDGHGWTYSKDGSRHKFAWAYLNESVKLPSGMDDFIEAFKHGLGRLVVKSEFDECTLKEIVEKSDWKK